MSRAKISKMLKTKKTLTGVHEASVDSREIDLIQPEPVPTKSVKKEKNLTRVRGLLDRLLTSFPCTKAKGTKKRGDIPPSAAAPIEKSKWPEVPEIPLFTNEAMTRRNPVSSPFVSTTINYPTLPEDNIGTITQKDFRKGVEVKKKNWWTNTTTKKILLYFQKFPMQEDRWETSIEKTIQGLPKRNLHSKRF